LDDGAAVKVTVADPTPCAGDVPVTQEAKVFTTDHGQSVPVVYAVWKVPPPLGTLKV
jgi:hypothetical protein